MGRPVKDYSYLINSRDLGELTVTRVWRDPDGEPKCNAVCSCGKKRDYKVYDLTRTKEPYRSCGCKKDAAYEAFTDRQLERLPVHLHIAMWDMAQEEGATLKKLAKAFGVEPAAARSCISGVQERATSFVDATNKNGWYDLARRTRSIMRNNGLDTFRFGNAARLPAYESRFKKNLVSVTLELRARWGDFSICQSEPVKSRFALVQWVYETYYNTLRAKRKARAKAAEAATNGLEWKRRNGPSPETITWRCVYQRLGVKKSKNRRVWECL